MRGLNSYIVIGMFLIKSQCALYASTIKAKPTLKI